jgi:hypothetical protein
MDAFRVLRFRLTERSLQKLGSTALHCARIWPSLSNSADVVLYVLSSTRSIDVTTEELTQVVTLVIVFRRSTVRIKVKTPINLSSMVNFRSHSRKIPVQYIVLTHFSSGTSQLIMFLAMV